MAEEQPQPRIAPLARDELDPEAMAALGEVLKVQAAPLAAKPGESAPPPPIEVPEFIATMARHPELFKRQAQLSALLFAGALPFRLTELVLLRTAWLCQGGYVWGHHSQLAQKACGYTGEDIERIVAGSAAQGWDECDRAVLRAVEELHEIASISDETWAMLAAHLDERQLIELPILVGQMHGVIYTQNALRVRLMPGSLGLAAR